MSSERLAPGRIGMDFKSSQSTRKGFRFLWIGTSFAFGTPSLVMMISCPCAARSSKLERLSLAARTLIETGPSKTAVSFNSLAPPPGFTAGYFFIFAFTPAMWPHVASSSIFNLANRLQWLARRSRPMSLFEEFKNHLTNSNRAREFQSDRHRGARGCCADISILD